MPSATSQTRPGAGITKFTNCRILRDRKLVPGELLISSTSGKILESQTAFYEQQTYDKLIDLGGKIISPGFIEVQINGAFGFDFSVIPDDLSHYTTGVKKVNRELIKTGVTSYLPTITSQRSEVYHKALPFLAPTSPLRSPAEGAEILGAHCEGPFISPRKNGIHNTSVLREAPNGFSDFEACYGAENLLDSVKLITLAPELPGALSSIPGLTSRGIVASIGHSEATYEEASAALEAGATMLTHVFNAMKPLHHRDPGIFGVLAAPGSSSIRKPYFGVIADGVHLHPSSVNIAWSAYPAGCILVTDAMRTLGLPNGTYEWTNGEKFTKDGPLLTLDGTDGKLCGTSLTLIECLNNFMSWSRVATAQALATITSTPAKMLGCNDTKGTIRPGADADLVILDEISEGDDTILQVDQVWKFGECVFERA